MNLETRLLEEKAYSLLSNSELEDAFKLFRRAAELYRSQGNHKQAALCFASAGSCWSKKSGEKNFHNAAVSYFKSATEAEKGGDYEYASLLYKHAAVNYERDGEYQDFSNCFYRSKESYRKFLIYRLIHPKKIQPFVESIESKGIKGAIKRFFSWLVLTFSYILWGHGERPSRTFFSSILVVCLSAFLYTLGSLLKAGAVIKPDFLESFYFSIVTFTTLGYGDITPLGFSKLVAGVEAFSALFIMPLFVIGLTRKYLRV